MLRTPSQRSFWDVAPRGKGGGGSPAPPDPAATAAAQAAANKEAVRESAKVNQLNEITPFGTQTFTGEIGEPDRTKTVALNPFDQRALDAQRFLAIQLSEFGAEQFPRVQSTFEQPFNFEGLPEISGSQDLIAGAQPLEQATFERGRNLIQPEFDRQRSQLETDLINRGLPQGSEAFNEAFNRLDRSQGAQLENLALSSVGAGRSEQSRLFGLEQAARGQAINERLAERGQPLNELAALIQGAPATPLPQFGGQAQFQVAPPDVQGAINSGFAAQQNAFNQQQSANNALTGGLFSLGGAALGGLFGGPIFG